LHHEIDMLRVEVASVRQDMQAMQAMQEVMASTRALEVACETFPTDTSKSRTGGTASVTSTESSHLEPWNSFLSCAAGDVDHEHWGTKVLFGLLGAGSFRGRGCFRVTFVALWVAVNALSAYTVWEIGVGDDLGLVLVQMVAALSLGTSTLMHWVCAVVFRPRCCLQEVKCKAVYYIAGTSLFLSAVASTVFLVMTTQQPDLASLFAAGLAWLLFMVASVMQSAVHLATSLLFQSDCLRAIGSLDQLSRSATHHDRAAVCVRQLKRRWHAVLRAHSLLEVLSLGLAVLRAFLYSKERRWADLVVYGCGGASFLCLMLCQILPLAAYNEVVARTHLNVHDFSTALRLKREPLEFRVLQTVIDKGTFRALLLTCVGSILSAVIHQFELL